MSAPGALESDRGGTSWSRRPAEVFGLITSGMNSLGTFWVFCLMFLICTEITGRFAFNYPIRGVSEIIGYSIVTAVFLQFANTLRAGRFTRAELLIDWLEKRRPAAGATFMALFHLLGAAVFGFITYGTYPKFVNAWVENEVTGVPGEFTFIIWPFLGIIVLGAGATTVEFAIQFLGSVRTVIAAIRRREADQKFGWPALLGYAAFVVAAGWIGTGDLSNVQIGLLSIVCMLVFIYCGMHVGVALMTLGFLGIWLIRGDPGLSIRVLSRASTEYLNSYFFGVVPLFVLMGLLVAVSDVGKETFEVARWALRRVKGGLGVATVVANAIFASITGSSIASAAVFTKIATPEMLRHGYTPRFSVGVVAGSSVLGMLIPPSLLLIIYGFLAEQSVGRLFLAAIVPGLILAAAMSLGIVLMAIYMPSLIGGTEIQDDDENIRSAAIKLLPIVLLVALVLGGIYGGVFTPTEAGAAGAMGALIIAIVRRKLTWANLWNTVIETGHVTVSILFLILAASIYGQMLAMSNLPQQVSGFAAEADLGLYGFMAVYIVLLVILGTILDSVSIMVITLPLAIPVVAAMGGDLIWFGIVSVVAVEIGLLTPPLGITVYVVKSTLDDPRVTLNDIFAGAFPFVIIMLLVVSLLVAFPQLSLILT
jgi:tripartite ATP-independent transporter DctM subunit